MFRNRKLIFMLFSLACFIAMGVCFIVDMAITKQITWSAYPLISIPFGWIVISPVFIKKHGKILSPCVFTLAILPYLYFLEKITPVSGWFYPLGLPCAITAIILGWVLCLLFLLTKMNIWYKASISIFLAGVIASPVINHFINAYEKKEPLFINGFINIFSCIVVAAILGILGYRKSKANAADANQ